MQPIGLSQALEAIQTAIADLKTPGHLQRAETLLWPTLDQFPDIAPLWFYAGCYLAQTGRHALAVRCYEKSYELQPNPVIWTDIGASYRCMNRIEECRAALMRGLEAMPNDPQILTNLAGSYVNEGDPQTGIGWGERAVAAQVNDKALWNLGLLYLEAGIYDKGFDLYAEGKHQHREERVYEPDAPLLTPQLHYELKGHGKTLLVYGEQGIGDELMFGTMLADVMEDYDIIFECHPRLEWLHQNSRHGDMQIIPTRKNFGPPSERPVPRADAKAAIGDLCRLYRRELKDFAWCGPIYTAPIAERDEFRGQLEVLAAGRPIIGVATRGGEISTATRYRRLTPSALEHFFNRDAFFVGLDYEDCSDLASWVQERFGSDRYFWPAAINFHWDYQHVAALIAATDAVVTVCQSVAHLSAGMGHSTHVLVPDKPAWRYGTTGRSWYWYPGSHAVLHRQNANFGNWNTAIDDAFASLPILREAA